MSRICRFCSHPCVTFLHLLCERAGTSLSSQESCTSRLFLGHREHTGSQQRKLGTTIHAPLNDAAVGSHALQEGPGSKAARVLQAPQPCLVGSLWQTTSTRARCSVQQK